MTNENIFEMEKNVNEEEIKNVVNAELKKDWIKTRRQGGTQLSYISGHTVIRLLNRAFGFAWSFEIVNEEIIESVPKADTIYQNGKRVHKKDNNGNLMYIPQPPVVKVLGRLSVPGYGVKEQYGSKVVIGGATEQESGFKAASTDAMKKCASLFGVGLELWGDEGMEDDDVVELEVQETQQAQKPQQQNTQPQQSQQQNTAPQQNTQQQTAEENPWKKEQEQKQAQSQTQGAQTSSGPSSGWKKADTERLKVLKQILAISSNDGLNVYTKEFFANEDATYKNISPSNIAAFNTFLTGKAENI